MSELRSSLVLPTIYDLIIKLSNQNSRHSPILLVHVIKFTGTCMSSYFYPSLMTGHKLSPSNTADYSKKIFNKLKFIDKSKLELYTVVFKGAEEKMAFI